MRKASLLVLIIVSLLATSFAGVGAPKASAATVSATASPTTTNTATALTVTISTTVTSANSIVLTLPSFQLPSSISPSSVTVNGAAVLGANIISSTQIWLYTSLPFSNYASIVLSLAAGIKTPVSAGTYAVTCAVGSDTGSASIIIGGGSSGGLTVTPGSTTVSAYPVTLTIGFTPTYSVSNMILSLSGYSILGSPSTANVYLSGGIGSLTSVTGSGSTLSLVFGTPLVAGYAYTVSIATGCGLMNPSTAASYTITATLSGGGSQTLTGSVAIGGGSVVNAAVQVSPAAPSTAALYTLSFYTSASSTLTNGDTISVQFPYGTTFSSANLNIGAVQVNNVASSSVTLSGYVVTIMVPYGVTVSPGGWVYVTFPASLGIMNPAATGSYYLLVHTSDDPTPVTSSSYQITGTSVTGVGLAVDPKTQGSAAQFTITFTTSSAGALQANYGTILVDFPSSVSLPSSSQISGSLVTVNGTAASSVTLTSNGVIRITTPVYIAPYQQVTVVLSKSIGIRNPSTTGLSVTVAISTSADVAPVSGYYTTITSQITQPQVQLTSYGAGSAAGYTISFSTGAAGSLVANSDKISIVFPNGTVVPSIIARDQVTVGNYAAYAVAVSGNRLDITPALSVAANSSVQIIVNKTAGIKNPSTPQSYTLQAYTSVETTPVTSASYAIANLPRTLLSISPVNPDGLSGYYKTRPTVVLSASSTTSSILTTYYSINGGAQQVYSASFQLPDGTDVLTYYSRDQQGNQEDAQTFTAKVDATAPTATIVSPVQGAVVGTSPVTIVGKVSPGMQVSIAGSSVTVSPTGDFTTSVALKEGSQAIVFTVTSVSGNVGQTQLSLMLDTTPPVLTITKPVMYSTVTASVVEVAGKTEPGAVVRVAGSAVTVNADGTFSMNVMLKAGDNLVEVSATDAIGNQRKTSIPVTYQARTVIHLQIGNKTALVNDVKKSLQSAPVNIKGTTMVPLRFIGEAFGATVTWDPVFQIIDIELKGSTIRLQIGANFASVAGKKVILQAVPVVLKGTTMVPIRFISEAFGAQVVWTAATQGIDITYPKP